jgi:hypothetical protein
MILLFVSRQAISQGALLLLLENGIRNQDLGPGMFFTTEVSFLLGVLNG